MAPKFDILSVIETVTVLSGEILYQRTVMLILGGKCLQRQKTRRKRRS